MNPRPVYPDLAEKIALVTGASRPQGIGAAICTALAAQGVSIGYTVWQAADQAAFPAERAELERLEAGWREAGAAAVVRISADLARPDAATQVLDELTTRLGFPHILINNAAHSTRDGYLALDATTLDAHYAVNMRTAMLLAATMAQRFPYPSGGRIINLTSGQGLGPMVGELAYAATKGAIEAFTRTLAAELAPHGITVNAIDPGATDTGWMDGPLREQLAAANGRGRVGMPADAARLAVFLASAAGDWISGQILHSRGAA